MRFRLGAEFLPPEEIIVCRSCGEGLDARLQHADTCSKTEACRGHYAVVNIVMDAARVADTQAKTEVRGLTETKQRPADIRMRGIRLGWKTAVDVCVCSPIAHQSGKDSAETAVRRNKRHYASGINDMHKAGIEYNPIVWTSEGRAHPAAVRFMATVSEKAARKRPGTKKQFERRWAHEKR